MPEIKPEATPSIEKAPDALCPMCQIKYDLNSEFPFSALWQDGVQDAGLMKFVPLISVAIEAVMLILVIVILTKK